MEGIERPNQERIRMRGEKKNCKYLKIIEVDTIKQLEMKEKNKKRVSPKKEETFWKQALLQKSHQRN